MHDINKCLEEFWNIAKNNGLNPYAIALKGSQNYNLHDEESDVDANLVFIPTLTQIRSGDSYSYKTEFGEVTCHNIYKFAEICSKGNPQWIEVVHSEYQIGNFDIFKHYRLSPSALKGMMMEKVHEFNKLYPSREKYVRQFGYDPKQLHHIIRLYHLLDKNVNILKYEGDECNLMLDIKRGRFPKTKEEAFELRDLYVKLLEGIYDERKLAYTQQPIDYEQLDEIVMEYLK